MELPKTRRSSRGRNRARNSPHGRRPADGNVKPMRAVLRGQSAAVYRAKVHRNRYTTLCIEVLARLQFVRFNKSDAATELRKIIAKRIIPAGLKTNTARMTVRVRARVEPPSYAPQFNVVVEWALGVYRKKKLRPAARYDCRRNSPPLGRKPLSTPATNVESQRHHLTRPWCHPVRALARASAFVQQHRALRNRGIPAPIAALSINWRHAGPNASQDTFRVRDLITGPSRRTSNSHRRGNRERWIHRRGA